MLSLCVMNPRQEDTFRSSSGTGPDGHEDKNSTSGDALPPSKEIRMKTVVVKLEFAGLTEEQVIDAIAAMKHRLMNITPTKAMRKNAVADAATTKGAAKTAMATSSPPDAHRAGSGHRYRTVSTNCAKKTAKSPKRPRTHAHRGRLRHLHRCPARLPHGRRRRVKRRKGPQTRSLLFMGGPMLPGGKALGCCRPGDGPPMKKKGPRLRSLPSFYSSSSSMRESCRASVKMSKATCSMGVRGL